MVNLKFKFACFFYDPEILHGQFKVQFCTFFFKFSNQKVSHCHFKFQICMLFSQTRKNWMINLKFKFACFFLQTRKYRMINLKTQICMLFFRPQNIAWSILIFKLPCFCSDQKILHGQYKVQICMLFSDQKVSHGQFKAQTCMLFFRPENFAWSI